MLGFKKNPTKRSLISLGIFIFALLTIGTYFVNQKMSADEELQVDTRMNISARVFDISTSKSLSGVNVVYSSHLSGIQPISITSDKMGVANTTLPNETTYDCVTLAKNGYATIKGSFLLNSATSQPKEVTLNIGLTPSIDPAIEMAHIHTFMPGENYFSLPIQPTNADPKNFISYHAVNPTDNSSFFKKYIPTLNTLLKWDDALKNFTAYTTTPRGQQFGLIQARQGYKLIYDGPNPTTVIFKGTFPTSSPTYNIAKKGMTFISYPLNYSGNLGKARVISTNGTTPLKWALSSGFIGAFRWHDGQIKDGLDQIDPTKTFWPGRAFWIETMEDNIKIAFTDPLAISDVGKGLTNDGKVVVNFMTNEPAFVKVKWGTAQGQYSNETPVETTPARFHRIRITPSPGANTIYFKSIATLSTEPDLPPVDDPIDEGDEEGGTEPGGGDEWVILPDDSDDDYYVVITPDWEIQNINIKDITKSSAVVTWDTTIPTKGMVRIYIPHSEPWLRFDESGGTPNISQTHTVNLTDLEPETEYQIEVISYPKDDLNINPLRIEADDEFKTKSGHNPKCEAISKIEDERWIPDEYKLRVNCTLEIPAPVTMLLTTPSMTSIEDLPSENIVNFPIGTEFSHTFDVIDEEIYGYGIIINPEVNFNLGEDFNEAYGQSGIVTTPSLSIDEASANERNHTIDWSTNFSSSSGVDIIVNETTTKTYPSATDFGKEHRALINYNDLEENTEYNYIIKAAGESGIEKLKFGRFTTPPFIQNVRVVPHMKDTIITWDTPGAASRGIVDYEMGSVQSEDFLRSHSVTLSPLTPLTTYNFTIEAITLQGKHYRYGPQSFTTLSSIITRHSAVTQNDDVTFSWETRVDTTGRLSFTGARSDSYDFGPGTIFTKTYENFPKGKYDYTIHATDPSGDYEDVSGYFFFQDGEFYVYQRTGNALTGEVAADYGRYYPSYLNITNVDSIHLEGHSKSNHLGQFTWVDVCPFEVNLSGNAASQIRFNLPCSGAVYTATGYAKVGSLYLKARLGTPYTDLYLGNPGIASVNISQFNVSITYNRIINGTPHDAGAEGSFDGMGSVAGNPCYDDHFTSGFYCVEPHGPPSLPLALLPKTYRSGPARTYNWGLVRRFPEDGPDGHQYLHPIDGNPYRAIATVYDGGCLYDTRPGSVNYPCPSRNSEYDEPFAVLGESVFVYQ